MNDAARPARTPSAYTAPALFGLGFRPFYLLAAGLAALSVPLWIAQYWGWIPARGYLSGAAWHAHEMVFGFAAAVITGFLFTAARNWTGLPTPTGAPLAALAALWLAARVALLTGPAPVAVALDCLFLPLVALALWLPLRKARNRNQFFVALLLVLAAANVTFHLAHNGALQLSATVPVRFALYIVIVIVTLMGGRVIPSFTANAVRAARVRPAPWRDRWSIGLAIVACVLLLAGAPAALTGGACAAAALSHLERLRRWDPLSTRAHPILWILHLSYAWIPLGFALHAAAQWGWHGGGVLADHALATGAVGGITLGMMTRTARGHTGRELRAGGAEVAAYVLVHAAAVVRVLMPALLPAQTAWFMALAAVLWSLAFTLYLWVFVPMLTRVRADGRPG